MTTVPGSSDCAATDATCPTYLGHPTWSATRVLRSGRGVPPSAVTGTTGRATTTETTALSAISPTTTARRQAWLPTQRDSGRQPTA